MKKTRRGEAHHGLMDVGWCSVGLRPWRVVAGQVMCEATMVATGDGEELGHPRLPFIAAARPWHEADSGLRGEGKSDGDCGF